MFVTVTGGRHQWVPDDMKAEAEKYAKVNFEMFFFLIFILIFEINQLDINPLRPERNGQYFADYNL